MGVEFNVDPPCRITGPASRAAAGGCTTSMHATTETEPDRAGRNTGTRGDEGETLALLVLWPALLVAILLLLVHAFIVTNAQAEAEVAASAGLRAAWRTAGNSDFYGLDDPNGVYAPYIGRDPHPDVVAMAAAAQDAVAQEAATEQGWRWWTPGAVEVRSDFCHTGSPVDISHRPQQGDPGWVRVVVSGEVYGPLAALWPDRLDQVYAAASGPAVLGLGQQGRIVGHVPAALPAC